MNNIIDLSNKTILVTGASSGIGRATCIELSKLGAKVIMIARREDKLKETVAYMEGKDHNFYTYDLAELNGIELLIKKIVSENGKLDGFVHCAGYGPSRPLNSTNPDFLRDVIAINCLSFIEIARLYAKKKNNNGGSIVAISSIGSVKADSAKVAYCTSKAAIDGAIRALSVELRPKNIRVNSLLPGWVRTEMYEDYINTLGDDARARMNANPKNTLVEPAEIASSVAFLLSDASSAISGVSIIANAVGI